MDTKHCTASPKTAELLVFSSWMSGRTSCHLVCIVSASAKFPLGRVRLTCVVTEIFVELDYELLQSCTVVLTYNLILQLVIALIQCFIM